MAYHQLNGGGAGGDNSSLHGISNEYSGDEHESRNDGDERPDSDLHDKPIYLLEHLATFTVNKDSGIVYPADGMRRLLQLEKTTGIWSQKMQLCLDYQWVLIMDYETGNIIERFPATLIQEPTAFTSTDAMELYNNIIVFIVSGGNGTRSEMHIFQSQSVSAVHLVEDLKNLRSGKLVTQQREAMHQPTQQQTQISSPNTSINTTSMRNRTEHHHHHHHLQQRSNFDQYGIRSNTVEINHNSSGNAETDSEHGGINDETSSTSSDKYERDVAVLNHCFDDIEKFIARLQHAAAASRELERRRRNRKSKKKDPGEGLLTLRTRPPHEKEFVDIFAKFKLSFNLLAKLKAHIHDPNAPELVHFLFTPLALIVEASSDTYYESQLPARVTNPLLTREAINLLINCVTSKETELWRSLGDAWIIPRDQWKEDVGSYHPVFLDGWSPDYLVVDELDTSTNINKRRLESQSHYSDLNGRGAGLSASGSYDEYDGSGITLNEKFTIHHGHPSKEREQADRAATSGPIEFSTHNDISIESVDRNELTSHTNANDNTTVQNSALMQAITTGIQNLHTRENKTIGAMGAYGGLGGVTGSEAQPDLGGIHTGVNTGDDQYLEAWLDDLQSAGAKIVLVTYPRTANNEKELSVVRGEYLEILDDTRKWWKARNIRGRIAHVPHTIVTPYNYGDTEPSNQFYTRQHQHQNIYKTRHSVNANAGRTILTATGSAL